MKGTIPSSELAALDALESSVSLYSDSREAEAVDPESVDVKVVSINVPGEIGYRGLVLRTVAAVCTMACPIHFACDDFRSEVLSAVGEAFNNAVFHAYEHARGSVCLTFSFDSARLAVELVETGKAFDPSVVSDLLGDEPQESGMGLFIIRSFMDELRYTPGPPNRLRMVKHLPQP